MRCWLPGLREWLLLLLLLLAGWGEKEEEEERTFIGEFGPGGGDGELAWWMSWRWWWR